MLTINWLSVDEARHTYPPANDLSYGQSFLSFEQWGLSLVLLGLPQVRKWWGIFWSGKFYLYEGKVSEFWKLMSVATMLVVEPLQCTCTVLVLLWPVRTVNKQTLILSLICSLKLRRSRRWHLPHTLPPNQYQRRSSTLSLRKDQGILALVRTRAILLICYSG